MLKLQNVSVCYDAKTILADISLSFAANKIYAVLGKSGSGKSTLLHALAGIKAYRGQIALHGEPLSHNRQRIALVPQKNSLVKWKTIRENILLPLLLRPYREPADLAKLCAELGIAALLDRYPNHVSGGEQQRAAIARAFLFSPDLLLLDEAFAALDAITKDEVHRIFLETIARHKVTTVFVTHDIDEALYLAEEIVIVKDGRCGAPLPNALFGCEKEKFPLQYREMHQFYKEQI